MFLLGLNSAVFPDEGSTIAAIPDSLGQWYKPINKRQVWLHTMFSLRRELQAIEEYATAKDLPHVRRWGEKFLTHYKRLPEMVPEWRDEVEPGDAQRLQDALEAGDFGRVDGAVDRLQRNCRNCHREYRALAALRFRSPDFSKLRIDGEQASGKDYGTAMNDLSRIKIASEDQRWPAALDASRSLRAQLAGLQTSCESCHDDRSASEGILGQHAQGILDRLDTALQQQQEKETGATLGEAAVAICARCHGIHRSLSDLRQQLFPVSNP